MAFSVGETLQADKYRLDALLDQRQWGMTFLATHQGIDQRLVIKTFQAAENGPSQGQLNAYINYAKKLTRFHHPNLSRVINIFEEDGQACMVSEFIQGSPLDRLIQNHPLDENTAITYIRQVAQGLHALHRHGLLHLNLSPCRIIKRQGDGKAVLVGLNSRFASQEAERHSNPYLSFEQHQTPATVSLASEIYSIAATLYTLVTGQPPVPACDRGHTPLILPSQLRAELSQSIEEAIVRGMALASSDRPQRMKDWIKLLPQPTKAEATTKLQIPSAWQVKLPAFREAGVQDTVSTVITPTPIPETKTTLQTPQPHSHKPDQTSQANGHSELGSHSPESSSASAPVIAATTLQLQQSTPAPTPSIQEPVPEPMVLPPSEPIAPDVGLDGNTQNHTDMSVAPYQKTSRFPRWTLFWCALIAACSGLAAGLWFRLHLTRQFAMPPSPVKSSPLDELKTLDTREEEFLPTQTSIIPEKKIEGSEDPFDVAPSAESTLDTTGETDNLDPELGERLPTPEWNETSPWQTRTHEKIERLPEGNLDSPEPPSLDPSEDPDFVEPEPSTALIETYSPDADRDSQDPSQTIESEISDSTAPNFYEDPSIEEERYTLDRSSFDSNSGTL